MSPWTPPTHSEAPGPRKPRRLGLIIPWALALALAAGWSLAWLWLMGETQRRLDAGAAALRADGWQVAWTARRVGGYPFRLDVDYTGLTVADPSGWGLAAPVLKTEAYAFAPTHWVFFAPSGLAVTRPAGGALNISGSALRGSVSGFDRSPANLALEGDDMVLTPGAGAAPPPFVAIRKLQVYTRPGPDDQGAAYLQIDDGQPAPATWLAALGGGKPADLRGDVIFNHASALQGRGWRDDIAAWSRAGGKIDLGHLALTAGDQSFTSSSGSFTVDPAGLLVGQLALQGGPAAQSRDLTLQFHDGGAWLGAVRVQPAPRLF